MSMVEGIGDEVIHFFGLLFVTTLGFIAWWSTGIRDRPQIRTVLILEHRRTGASNNAESPLERSDSVQTEVTEVENENSNENESEEGRCANISETSVNDDSASNCKENKIESKTLLKQKRLAYFDSKEESDTPSSSVRTEVVEEQAETQRAVSSELPDNIRIRLKYLNDDQKLVEGRLQELLGDFKRRHFSVELSADKLVRLIFNGQVLQSDDQTLQGYGLYDNCVVHCLVHTQRANINRTNAQPQINNSPPEWNLGLLLYACISLILGLAWFFRYHYSQLFTMTTTAALVGLTIMFAVSMIGLYMPDHEPVPSH